MCLTCGCMLAHEDHGKPGYLTYEDLRKSAAIDGISVAKAIKRLRQTTRQDRNSHPTEYEQPASVVPPRREEK